MWQIQGLQVQGKHLYIYQLHRLLLKTQLMMTLIIYQKYHNYQHDHCIKDYYKSIKSCNARNDVPNMSIPSLSYMGLKKPSTNWINHQVIKNVTATGKRTTLWIGNMHQKLVRRDSHKTKEVCIQCTRDTDRKKGWGSCMVLLSPVSKERDTEKVRVSHKPMKVHFPFLCSW